MDAHALTQHFARMGARIRVAQAKSRAHRQSDGHPGFSIDIDSDGKGEFFRLQINDSKQRFRVLDVRPKDRHLLLLADGRPHGRPQMRNQQTWQKLLCGHDERSWFVASVRDDCASVDQAKESLKPRLVRESQIRNGVKKKNRHRRHNAGFVRQGEWFFIPTEIKPDERLVLRNEPIQRAVAKPHTVEFLFRKAGEMVQVCWFYPNGLTETEFAKHIKDYPEHRNLPWRTMVRQPDIYVRGHVRHPDHRTVYLSGWHRAVPNAERNSTTVVYLD